MPTAWRQLVLLSRPNSWFSLLALFVQPRRYINTFFYCWLGGTESLVQMIGEGDCGAIGGMKIGRGIRSTRREPAPAPLYLPQIPLDQTRDRTRATAVGGKPATNRLSYGVVLILILQFNVFVSSHYVTLNAPI
jgi:hypothetical protein